MNMPEIAGIESRLRMFADGHDSTPPTSITGEQGAPSKDLVAFCAKHNLTLDWAVLGEGQVYRRAAPTISSIENDTTYLHGMLQGLEHLIDNIVGGVGENTPVANAVASLSQEVVEKCGRILKDIGDFERGRAGK